jgi:NDP-sugar pyrophosphorylase family protein
VLPIAILAGGLASRLEPISRTIPKSLVEIAGEPFLAHQLRMLRRNGFRQVVICAGHLGDQIVEYCGNGRAFDLDIRYSFDGPVLLGTAGALKNAIPLLGDVFFALYGDSYLLCNYTEIQHAFLEAGLPALMTVYRNDGRWDSSNVEFDGARILAYDKVHRTPRMHHIDYGLGAFRREAFDRVSAGEIYDLAQLYQELLAHSQLAAREVSERFYEIGSHCGIHELTERLSP